MAGLIAFLKASPIARWGLMAAIALGSLALATTLGHHRGVTAGRAQVAHLIEAPNTGWRARLAQCTTALTTQNAKVAERSGEATATLKTQGVTLRGALPAVKRAETAAKVILRPLKPTDGCDEVDRRFLETLK